MLVRTPLQASGLLAAALATSMACAGAAQAQVSNITEFGGTATGSGKIDRTIIDISAPGSPQGGAVILRVQGGSITVPVTAGKTAPQIGTAFRDSINTDPALQASGYSAAFDPRSDSTRVKMTRASGSFSVVDCETVPGVTMTVDGVVVAPCGGSGSAQGPLLSPLGLTILVTCLSALAYRERRRRR